MTLPQSPSGAKFPPDKRQLQIERLTDGALKAEPDALKGSWEPPKEPDIADESPVAFSRTGEHLAPLGKARPGAQGDADEQTAGSPDRAIKAGARPCAGKIEADASEAAPGYLLRCASLLQAGAGGVKNPKRRTPLGPFNNSNRSGALDG